VVVVTGLSVVVVWARVVVGWGARVVGAEDADVEESRDVVVRATGDACSSAEPWHAPATSSARRHAKRFDCT
jgi:hypothetical protein